MINKIKYFFLKLLNKENKINKSTLLSLQNVATFMPGNFYWKDKEGHYLGCNDAVLHTINVKSLADLIGKTDFDLWPEQAAEIRKNDMEVMCSETPLYKLEEVEVPNHGRKSFTVIKIPLLDKKGSVIGIIGNSIDISEIKEAQKKLVEEKENAEAETKTNESYLKNILACTPGNLYWKDKNGFWLGCNNYSLQELKLQSVEELRGKTDYDFFTKEQADILRKNELEVMNSGKSVSYEEVVTLSNGKKKTYAAVKMPLKDLEGNVIGIIGNSLDITELKETQAALLEAKEKAEAANIAKDMFMENMSHDFKTPLNGIWGVVQLLSDKKEFLPDEIKELIEVQEKSVKRLRRMIDSILDFNKIHAGKIQIERDEFNLLDIIESVVYNVSFQIKHKDIDILIDYPADVPRHLLSDSHCVNSIILNLMSNAVKFTEQGYVTISVKTLRQQEQKIELQIEVQDTGEGIPPDKFEEIFERFHRLELSNKGLKEGHGIGLSAVKELVDKLNGEISVKSEVNQGSVFTVVLPFEVLDNAYWVSEWKKNHPAVRILLISDKPTSSDILLSQGGMVTKIGSDAAINCLRQAQDELKPYEVIIIDDEIHLPLLTLVKMIHQAVRAAAMILLSIRPKKDKDKAWYDAAHQAGCFDFIMKPVLPSEMDKKIVQTWQKWKNGLTT